MSEESQEQKDVNSQVTDAASSSADGQKEVVNSPTSEKLETTESENRVPLSRLNEVIDARNAEKAARMALEARLRDLEAVQEAKPDAVAEGEVKRLMAKLQMSEEAAREIVQTNINLDKSRRQSQEAKERHLGAQRWVSDKAKNDPMYKELEPELERAFGNLSPKNREMVSTDVEALDMFYEGVKAKTLQSKTKDSFNKGADEAYKNKGLKQAVSSGAGSGSSSGKTSLEGWTKWSSETYMKRLPEINEAMKNGTLPRK